MARTARLSTKYEGTIPNFPSPLNPKTRTQMAIGRAVESSTSFPHSPFHPHAHPTSASTPALYSSTGFTSSSNTLRPFNSGRR